MRLPDHNLFLSFALTLGLSPAIATSQVTFDSSIESGNGRNFTQVNANTYSFRLEPDTNAVDRHWFYFVVNGAEGQTLTLRLLETNTTNVPSHWNTARPIASPDGGETWDHVTGSVSHSNNVFSFTHTFESDSERIAFHHPYTWTMLQPKLDEWADSPYAARTILGESVEGRPIWFFQVTGEDGIGDPGEKLGIWIIARQHSAETTSSYSTEALMDYILSEEEGARALRANTVINVVPMVNPDGVIAGNYRQNRTGRNLNRKWDGSANAATSPEVLVIKEAIDEWVSDGYSYDMFLDIHSTSGANPHFAFHAAAGVQPSLYHDPPNYHAHTRQWLSLVNDHAPHFHPTRGASTSTNQQLAYHNQRIQYGVLAFTPEGAYNRQNYGPTPNAWMTPQQHYEVGVAMAKAIVDYYELEAPPTRFDAWELF